MKKPSTQMTKITWGFVLSAALTVGAVVFMWNTPVLWEFFLSRNLPNFQISPTTPITDEAQIYEEPVETPPPPQFSPTPECDDEMIVKSLD